PKRSCLQFCAPVDCFERLPAISHQVQASERRFMSWFLVFRIYKLFHYLTTV
ncbi:hypothetical protein COCCADRAFT_106067, partial [Bipolaris zeicola 26-R-13]